MIRVERRASVSYQQRAAAAGIAGLLTLGLLAAGLAARSIPLPRGLLLIAQGAFGSFPALEQTIGRAALLILCGLAASTAFRIKIYNFGTPGQAQAGALAALAVSAILPVPAWLMAAVLLPAGAFAGAVLMLPAVLLRI